MSFPYKRITKEDALRDWDNLKNKNEPKGHSGNKLLDYFFYPKRIKTKLGKWSHFSAWNNPEQNAKIKKFANHLLKPNDTMLEKENMYRYAMRMKYGTNNQFKAIYAKMLYKSLGVKSVMDFTSGWGGRMLGAMALGIDYTGIDSNKNLVSSYKNFMNFMKGRHSGNVRFISGFSENIDFSKYNYDCVFTSPPYEYIEKYEGMKEYEDFYKNFLYKVIENSYKNLKKGGWFCLNIKNDMYLKVKKILGSHTKKYRYSLSNITSRNTKNFEFIYCWKK